MVNAIARGPSESKMMAFLLDDPVAREKMVADVPLGRICQPDEVIGVILYLCSRAGAYLTGVVIPLDGGMAQLGTR